MEQRQQLSLYLKDMSSLVTTEEPLDPFMYCMTFPIFIYSKDGGGSITRFAGYFWQFPLTRTPMF